MCFGKVTARKGRGVSSEQLQFFSYMHSSGSDQNPFVLDNVENERLVKFYMRVVALLARRPVDTTAITTVNILENMERVSSRGKSAHAPCSFLPRTGI